MACKKQEVLDIPAAFDIMGVEKVFTERGTVMDSLKLLFVGNSFAVDTMEYAAQIARSLL